MKILAYSLLILGFVLVALGRPSSEHPKLPMMIIGITTNIVAVILLCRLQLSISQLEATDKERDQVKEMRHGSGIWGLLAKFTAIVGFLSLVSGITYPLYADSHPDLGWRDAIGCMVFGAFLLFCSRLLI